MYLLLLLRPASGYPREALDKTRLIWDRRKGNSCIADMVMQNAALTKRRCTFRLPGESGHTECLDNGYPMVP